MSATWISSVTELRKHATLYRTEYYTTFVIKGKHNMDISLNEIFQDEYDYCMINYNSTVRILSIVCTIKNNVENLHNILVYEGGIDISCPDDLNYQSVQILNRQTYQINLSDQYKCVLSIRADINFLTSEVQIHAITVTQPKSHVLDPQINRHKISFSKRRVLLWCLLPTFFIIGSILHNYYGYQKPH